MESCALICPEFSAVLLAGGRSSRMGRDKALLPHPLSGLPLLVHQAATLRAAGCAELFLSVREGADYPQIGAEVPRLFDDGERGPLPVIEGALAIINRPVLFLLAVDMPFVTVDVVRSLVARSSLGRGVVMRGREGFEPLCAVYPKTARPPLQSARGKMDFALQPLIARGVADGWMLVVDDLDPAAFANWNAPRDLAGGQTARLS
jgi:molybdopterin-guanine dinucleotide biosynthesis protein A